MDGTMVPAIRREIKAMTRIILMMTSRDHQVVETTANRIMEIINGQLIDKITTYDEYLESDEMARKRFTYTITESEENDD